MPERRIEYVALDEIWGWEENPKGPSQIQYDEYLDSTKWRTKRTHIRRRARGWCERCGWQRRVDVHHLTYERLGQELPGDLIAVCEECHQFLHGKSSYDPASLPVSPGEIVVIREAKRELDFCQWCPELEEMVLRHYPSYCAIRERIREHRLGAREKIDG